MATNDAPTPERVCRFIDGVWEPVEEDTLSISFSGEASEGFSDRIGQMKGWFVRLTPKDNGVPFDAVIYGPGTASGSEWLDSVAYQYADEDGLPILDQGVEIIRVSDVYVY